jgi:hypothetical protein
MTCGGKDSGGCQKKSMMGPLLTKWLQRNVRIAREDDRIVMQVKIEDVWETFSSVEDLA